MNLNNVEFSISNWKVNGINFSLNAGTSKLLIEKQLLHNQTGNCTFYDATFSELQKTAPVLPESVTPEIFA